MRRSRLKPKKVTLIQHQKSHKAPIYNICINCGFNTDRFITNWDELILPHTKHHPFETIIAKKYGERHPSGIPIMTVYLCSEKCISEFVDKHQLDILEEITK